MVVTRDEPSKATDTSRTLWRDSYGVLLAVPRRWILDLLFLGAGPFSEQIHPWPHVLRGMESATPTKRLILRRTTKINSLACHPVAETNFSKVKLRSSSRLLSGDFCRLCSLGLRVPSASHGDVLDTLWGRFPTIQVWQELAPPYRR